MSQPSDHRHTAVAGYISASAAAHESTIHTHSSDNNFYLSSTRACTCNVALSRVVLPPLLSTPLRCRHAATPFKRAAHWAPATLYQERREGAVFLCSQRLSLRRSNLGLKSDKLRCCQWGKRVRVQHHRGSDSKGGHISARHTLVQRTVVGGLSEAQFSPFTIVCSGLPQILRCRAISMGSVACAHNNRCPPQDGTEGRQVYA